MVEAVLDGSRLISLLFMDKLKIELSNPNFDPRNNWQWDNDDSLEQLIMSLNDMKMSLETDLA